MWRVEGLRQLVESVDLVTFDAPLYFLSRLKDRFFVGALDPRLPETLVESHASHVAEAIHRAELVCKGYFRILGYGSVHFGNPTNWHFDPISGSKSARSHWSRINHLDYQLVADHKVVWELNRHQWLLDLGKAYQFTRNERYAVSFARLLNEWLNENPHGIGINWANSLEISIRLISWCWAVCLFRGSSALSGPLFNRILVSIRQHASHIERYLSTHSPNTHLTGEALGLFYAGTLFQELPEAKTWRRKGEAILEREASRQIHPDGVYFEQSTCYQYYTLEFYLHYIVLSLRNGFDVPQVVLERCEKMLEFLSAIRFPDGDVPQIGDADGGWLAPLVARDREDFRGLFSTGAILFSRSDLARAAEGVAPESYWLLGVEAETRFNAISNSPPPGRDQRYFRDGGYVVVRSGYDQTAHQLLMDVGNLGCNRSGGHGHADALSIQCAAFGETYLTDPGTFCYTPHQSWRSHFRGTSAHNTVVVDGKDQYEPAGAFAWLDTAKCARLIHREATAEYDLIEASHNAYERLGVTVRRRVMFFARRYWVVIDDVEGSGQHSVGVNFQFAPLDVELENPDWVRAHGKRGFCLLLRTFSACKGDMTLRRGDSDPKRGWLSPNYGARTQSPHACFHSVTSLPARFVTVLYPCASSKSPPPVLFSQTEDVTRLEIHNGTTGAFRITNGEVQCVRH